ncbi:MAG: PQQ-dependent sugar dehydrogenase, partial [Cyclobacteriaceae bacterium]|nr:PQQ-dependent sugar dehydrogenase [Cyclobacteriaceae bacterium]
MRHVLVVMAMFILFSCSNERNIKKLLIIGKHQGNTDLIISSAYDQTDTTSSFSILESDSLKNYSTIAMLDANLMGVTPRQQTGLQRYMEASGSLVVSHTPINTYQWPWLHALQSREETSGHYGGGSYAFLETLEESHAVLLIGENTWQANHITTEMAPDENRFIIKELNNDLYEPMEIEILPDNRVMIMERRGKIKLYNPATNSTKVIANFDVCIEGNYEDGLLGMALDPDFENNRNVFIYYSPPCENTNQLLSRFKMSIMDTLIMASEKVVMEVKVQRETCCHSGGEVMFDHEGYLWLSTGDNTSSKESDGYTPIDERPGRFPFDAQKSSGNTHDLRGKILKIKVHPDGSYTIPEGNLFPPDGSKGRPEIYVMGARNPFRFTVDPKTGYLYWGDVGPDAGKDSRYGSESYDEWNQARTPGYYGWPYFMGNNITFPDRNFTTDEVGEHFNPEHPINDSPNNTGSRELPPARPAMVYYPYGESKEFPMLGTGSRSAMGGPFYYAPNVKSEVAFPDYFTGKMFIFEWARSWVKVMSFDEDANLVKIEPFLDNYQFSKPIDVEFGPDGAMYVVDYGANYFSNNEDARLIKIEYRKENIPPTAVITTEENTGGAPFTAEFKAENSFDLDRNDVISYQWFIKGEKEPFSHDSVATYTFEKTGNHTVVLEAIDKNGGKGNAQQLIRVGNSRPEVSIQVDGNKTFYFAKDQKLSYQVSVTDAEDGTTENESIPAASVNIQFNYMKQGLDMANIGPEMFEGASIQYVKGKNLIDGSDCKSCHDLTKKSIGPSYMAVAEKYKGRYVA